MRPQCRNYFLFLLLFILGSFFITSCVDENVDMDNISEDVQLNGTYYLPVLHSKITMTDIIREYGESDDAIVLGGVDVEGSNLVALFYEDNFSYAMNSDENINGGFSNLKLSMESFDFPLPIIPVAGSAQAKGIINLTTSIPADPNGGEKKDSHIIRKIELTGATANITQINGVTPKNIEIKSEAGVVKYSQPLSSFTFFVDNITLEENDSIKINFDFAAGTTLPKEDITLNFRPQDYVAWGWFDYRIDDINKNEFYSANLSEYIDNSSFTFCDPQFEFTISNKNIGVPIIFNLRNIVLNDDDLPNLSELKFDGGNGNPFKMPYPTTVGSTDSKPFEVNRGKSQEYKFDYTTYTTFVGTNLKKVTVGYDLLTDQEKFDEKQPMQFISSSGEININAKVILPFWINKGFLSYSNTIKDLDLGDSDFDLGNETAASLQIKYTNSMPFEMHLQTFLIEGDDNQIIEKKFKEPKDGDFFRVGEISADGFVTKPYSGELVIDLSKAEYDQLKEAKDLKLLYFSDQSTNKVVKVRTSDYLEAQVGVIIKGSVIIKEDK